MKNQNFSFCLKKSRGLIGGQGILFGYFSQEKIFKNGHFFIKCYNPDSILFFWPPQKKLLKNCHWGSKLIIVCSTVWSFVGCHLVCSKTKKGLTSSFISLWRILGNTSKDSHWRYNWVTLRMSSPRRLSVARSLGREPSKRTALWSLAPWYPLIPPQNRHLTPPPHLHLVR